jgi:DNA-binding GntR family transcriptional regulator
MAGGDVNASNRMNDWGGTPGHAPERGTAVFVVRALEEDIVLGRLHPRERLIEEDLCDRFAVSRHILRLALAELDRMGLIERFRNRGAQVKAFSPGDVEQLYILRDLLETSAAEQIVLPVGQADLDELKRIQARHDQAVANDDPAGIFRMNHDFHRKLFSLCRNTYLAGAIETYAQQAHAIRFLVLNDREQREKARDEHHQMIAALETADRGRLVTLCKNHLPASKAAYLRAYGKILG